MGNCGLCAQPIKLTIYSRPSYLRVSSAIRDFNENAAS